MEPASFSGRMSQYGEAILCVAIDFYRFFFHISLRSVSLAVFNRQQLINLFRRYYRTNMMACVGIPRILQWK